MIIDVLGLDFEVIETPVIEHGSNEIGRVDHIKQKIYLLDSLTKEIKKVVLVHEILHSIFEQLGFNEEHDNEHLIDCLAKSIIQIFSKNKDFTSFLL